MISLPGFVSKLMTMADGSVRVFFDAQELKPDVVADLYKFRNKHGIMVFIPDVDELSDEEREFLESIGKKLQGDGSPMQLLRNKIFKYWKWEQGKSPDVINEFEKYYKAKVEAMMETIERRMV